MVRSAVTIPVGALLATLIAAPQAAGQVSPASPFLHAPRLGGAGIFVAPRASASIGRLDLSGGIELAWGDSEAWGASGLARYALFDAVGLTPAWSGAVTRRGEERQEESVFMLGVDLPRGGISAARHFGTAGLDDFSSSVAGTDLRAWLDLGTPLDLSVGVTLRSSDVIERGGTTWERRIVVGGYEFVSATTIEYLEAARHEDIELDLSATLRRLRVTGVLGRGTSEGPAESRTWAYGRIATPILPGAEIRLEGGTNAGIPAIGRLPGGFLRLGVSVSVASTQRQPPLPEAPPRELAREPRNRAVASLEEAAGSVFLVIRCPDAALVEVRGDFTGWETEPMTRREAGVWALRLPPGVLRFNVRIDGGEWEVPDGLPAVPDEFTGAPVAVTVVPAG